MENKNRGRIKRDKVWNKRKSGKEKTTQRSE